MKVLLTGNCGFIGQNLVRLYRDKYEFIGLDKMGYASDVAAAKQCPTWQIDLSVDDLDPVFKNRRYDCVIHMAAESHVDNSINSPEPFVQSNVFGTFRLLEAIRKHDIDIRKIIIISTDEVYGDLQPADPPFSDFNLLKPSSPYSASKTAADLLALSYERTYGMNISITRGCNTYGPYQYKEKLIPVIISKALKNEKIPIYGSGQNIREWMYVDDHCCGIMKAFWCGKPGKIYNLGSGLERTNINIAEEILKIMGKTNLIEFVKDRPGHDLRYAMDSSNSYQELSWKPEINLYNGLRKTVEWYLENKEYLGE